MIRSWCCGYDCSLHWLRVGKTRTGINAIKLLLKKKPDAEILVSVPTEVLKEQWMEELIKNGIFQNCKVVVINSIVKKEWEVDFLLIDECLSM